MTTDESSTSLLNSLQTQTIDNDLCEKVYRSCLMSRLMDLKMEKLVRQNKGGTFHMNAMGHELVGSVFGHVLTAKEDWGLPYYRDRAFSLSFGACPVELFGVFLGRETKHHSKGRMMPDHFSDKYLHIPVQSSVVGSQILHAVGVAKGLKLSRDNSAVYVSAGDGATSQGDFHEALNFACLHKLGVVFVIQDNGWAISVPTKDQTTGGCISKIAKGYENLNVEVVDGTSFFALEKAAKKAKTRAENFEGPTLIVAKTPRLGPHSSSDDPKKYKTDDEIFEEKGKDPISVFEAQLLEKGLYTNSQLEAIKQEIEECVEKAAKEAEKIPFPSSNDVENYLFKDSQIPTVIEESDAQSIVMVDALNHALHEAMEEDQSIVVFGQDVADGKGGVFGVTKGLSTKFGSQRCFNSPLAESTIIGVAIGLCFTGKFKPVVEIQFADYIWTAINQIFNELASVYYRSAGEWNCPLVVRMPTGGYIQGGPYHSQSIEGFLAHCPGLKVVIPSNAEDAKRLLKASIKDPNPVLFLEHKGLYRQRTFSARNEPKKTDIEPLGKAKVLIAGDDLTIVSWGMSVVMSREVVQGFLDDGYSVELIDLRTIVPFDKETVLESVKKTGKVLIVHEASKFAGFGAEIASEIAEECFESLDAPVCRLGSQGSAVPYSKPLEDAHLIQKQDIKESIQKLLHY